MTLLSFGRGSRQDDPAVGRDVGPRALDGQVGFFDGAASLRSHRNAAFPPGHGHECCGDARDAERLFWSREIHDRLGQHTAALLLSLHRLASSSAANGPSAELAAVFRHVDLLEQEFRQILSELEASAPRRVDLGHALRVACRRAAELAEVPVRCRLEVGAEAVPEKIKIAVLRIVQEALTNMAKHATGATQVSVAVDRNHEDVVFAIEDDGRAFSPALEAGSRPAACGGSGRGLAGMQARAAALGGSLSARALPDRGFQVSGRIPLTCFKYDDASL